LGEAQNIEIATALNSRPWWIGDLLTVISILVGFGLIAFQLKRQHENDISTQRENNREQLRLEIYQEFSTCLDEANSKTSKASGYAFNLSNNVSMYTQLRESSMAVFPVSQRANEFTELHSISNHSIIELIKLIEKYEIVSPKLEIFKLAFNAASYDITQAYTDLIPYLFKVLPMDIVDDSGILQVQNVRDFTREEIDELNSLINKYCKHHNELGGYLFDLNLELQKTFLGNLFENQVKERRPIDPKCIVVSTEPSKVVELTNYFENKSSWGINQKMTEEEVRDQYK
jgi:hypothetical protein